VPAVGQELGPVVIQLALPLVDPRDADGRPAVGGHAVDAVEILREQNRPVPAPHRRTVDLRRADEPCGSTGHVDLLQGSLTR
jgi:hypothetical protein